MLLKTRLHLGVVLLCSLAAMPLAWSQTPAARNAGALQKAAPGANEGGKRYALVIGNASYSKTTPLTNPVNDGRAICKMLRSLEFEVDCYENVKTRGAFRQAVSDFTRKVGPTDVALFYYAGHGIERAGESYLLPVDADIRSKAYVEDDGVKVNFIFDELTEAKAKLSIVILDACRNDPFAKNRSIAGQGGLTSPKGVPTGSMTIFPTQPGEVALDGDGENGVFTSHLLKHLPSAGISIEEMFKRVQSGVREQSAALGKEQVPLLNLSFSGEFCFAGCGTKINPDDYANALTELAVREDELKKFQARMVTMQQQLEVQEKSQHLSKSEMSSLAKQRDELVAKTTYLDSQQKELNRVKEELQSLQVQQVEFAKREKEMALARDRIASLEQKIKQQDFKSFNPDELNSLRRDRDALIASNQILQDRQIVSEAKQKELAEVQQRRLQEYDKQRGELDAYKVRLSQLEVENREKDESVKQMRAELETRQVALGAMKERMQVLQRQMEEQQASKTVVAADQARLQAEREGLARKARELEARERDLRDARSALVQAERQGNDQQAKQELIALQSRLSEYDKQKSELDTYKIKLSQLEVENREKDESVKQMRAELETRQVALGAMKERMQLLQRQMEEQQEGKSVAVADQARLKAERDELARKGRELEARERDLLEARSALAQAERQSNDQQAKQELIALQGRLSEYDRQKNELDGYKRQMARMESTQVAIQGELKHERETRQKTEEKLRNAATSIVKDAAFVPPAF